MSILEKIQEQPQHIREIMFGLSVITTVSLVGAIWFRDLQKDMYALLNPEEVKQEKFLAQNNDDSLFAIVGKTLGDISSILNDFWGSGSSEAPEKTGVETKPINKVYLLPLSEEK